MQFILFQNPLSEGKLSFLLKKINLKQTNSLKIRCIFVIHFN
jgi:hypothetical protein